MKNTLTLQNGSQMPLLGFGTWQLRGEQCQTAVLRALEIGYRLIDTARYYQNEQEVGAAILQSGVPRSQLFVTDKLFGEEQSYEGTTRCIHESLSRLGLDYLDLMLLHEPYKAWPEMYRAMEDACEKGLIRAIGISNFSLNQTKTLLQGCRIKPAVSQCEGHPYCMRTDLQIYLKKQGIVLQNWSPLTQGRARLLQERVVLETAAAECASPAAVVLAYLRQNGRAVVCKANNPLHMRQNLSSLQLQLKPEQMYRLSRLNKEKSLFGWDDDEWSE